MKYFSIFNGIVNERVSKENGQFHVSCTMGMIMMMVMLIMMVY